MPHTFAESIDTEALTKKWGSRNLDPYKVLTVAQVNFRPHAFVIGPGHVNYASRHHNGMLGTETVKAVSCAHCGYDAQHHMFDVVIIIRLVRNATCSEAQQALKGLGEELEKDGINGFAFSDSPDFKIIRM